MNFLFGIVAIAIGATVRALPVVEEMRAGGSRDRIRSGAEILLALQQVESAVRDGDVVSHGSIADGLRAMPCTSIMQAAQEPVGSGAPMRLVFAALEAANSDLSKLTCVRAFSQVTQVLTLYVTVAGVAADGSAVTKTCKVLRRRQTAGGQTIVNRLPEIREDGTDADTAAEKERIKEGNRYEIVYCKPDIETPPANAGAGAGSSDDQPTYELQALPARAYSTGYIPLPPHEWAALPTAPEPTAEELLQLPASYDERNSGLACGSYAIVDQGNCGACWAFAASRVYSDRMCRATSARWSIALSEQHLVQCNKISGFYTKASAPDLSQAYQMANPTLQDGCQGSSPVYAW